MNVRKLILGKRKKGADQTSLRSKVISALALVFVVNMAVIWTAALNTLDLMAWMAILPEASPEKLQWVSEMLVNTGWLITFFIVVTTVMYSWILLKFETRDESIYLGLITWPVPGSDPDP